MKTRVYLILVGEEVLDVFEGSARSCQKYLVREYHDKGIKAVMVRASRQQLKQMKEDNDGEL